MHVAIDDTYGPTEVESSRYMTGRRRTFVAVEFPDADVEHIRSSIRACLDDLPELLGVKVPEFHFVDIYNRKGGWKKTPESANLAIFEFFADIYRQYRWTVHVQTVDDRTLSDHGLAMSGRLDEIDLSTREGQALMLLLVKVKSFVPHYPEKLTIRIDEGPRRPGSPFAAAVFREWKELYDGRYASSAKEPLLQIADFLAFSINRSTHLQLKAARTDTDLWFLNLIATMEIRSRDLKRLSLDPDFTTDDIDDAHADDRRAKGLE